MNSDLVTGSGTSTVCARICRILKDAIIKITDKVLSKMVESLVSKSEVNGQSLTSAGQPSFPRVPRLLLAELELLVESESNDIIDSFLGFLINTSSPEEPNMENVTSVRKRTIDAGEGIRVTRSHGPVAVLPNVQRCTLEYKRCSK